MSPAPSKPLRITLLVFRTLMGLLLLWSSLAYFFDLVKVPPLPPGPLKCFDDGIRAARYLLPVVKGIEGFCALCFLSGRLVPFAAVLIAPILVNIVLVAAFLAPFTWPMALFLVIANGLVAWVHRDRYRPLFER